MKHHKNKIYFEDYKNVVKKLRRFLKQHDALEDFVKMTRIYTHSFRGDDYNPFYPLYNVSERDIISNMFPWSESTQYDDVFYSELDDKWRYTIFR